MALGGPTSWLLEVQWDGTTFVDESAYLKADAIVEITRGRTRESDDIQVGTMTCVLDNARVTVAAGVADTTQVGRFTPDSPLSPLWPNVTDGKRVRFTVTRGGTPSVRHRGRGTVSTPVLPDGDVAAAEVGFESVDVLATVAGRDPLRCNQVERALVASRTNPYDIFPFEPGAQPTELPNLGNGGGTATLLRPLSGVGAAELVAPEGIQADGALSLKAKDGVGPVVYIRTGVVAAGGTANDVIVPFRTNERVTAGGDDKYVVLARDASGAELWSVRLFDSAGRTDLNFYDGAGTLVGTMYGGWSPIGSADGDDQWFAIWLRYDSVGDLTTAFLVRTIDDTVITAFTATGVDVRNTRDVILGGFAQRRTRRKQTRCVTAQYGPTLIGGPALVGTARLSADISETAFTRAGNIAAFAGVAREGFGSTDRLIAITATSGRSAFDCLAEICRSTGATIVASPTLADTVRLLLPNLLRSPNVALTLDADADLAGGDGIIWSKGSGFSSVTATYPGGSVTYTDPTRPAREGQITVAALSESHAVECASAIVNTARQLRIEQLTIDLAGASNDLWSAVMALEVGARIRVTLGAATSPLARHYGRTYVNVYVLGWTERYGEGVAEWVIDTIAADDPVAARFDSVERGRFAARPGTITVTGGTAVGTTGVGTIVATTAPGEPAITVAPAAYPLKLDWSGEYVLIPSPPASATSPQTLTIGTRGVDMTIARVHATGEPLQTAYPAARAF